MATDHPYELTELSSVLCPTVRFGTPKDEHFGPPVQRLTGVPGAAVAAYADDGRRRRRGVHVETQVIARPAVVHPRHQSWRQ